MSGNSRLEVIPLGGLGEFGMNLLVYRHGRDCLVVDAGMMFPRDDSTGIDAIVPDLSFLEHAGTLHGVVLTHGHEDHLGALPYLLRRHDLPVVATPYATDLLRLRLAERAPGYVPRTVDLDAAPVRLGPFEVEAVPVSHSIPEARALAIRTPAGLVVHTADFKLDPTPVEGQQTDLAAFARLAREGVLLLCSDSTNAGVPGITPSERRARGGLARAVASAHGRVAAAIFASHVPRLRGLLEAARATDRHVALTGGSLQQQAEIAERHGHLAWPPGLRVSETRAAELPPARVLIAASGTQGEARSALARLASGRHRELTLDDGDTLLYSARRIPGNERTIDTMFDAFRARGVTVRSDRRAELHVSGHASAAELAWLLRLLAPRHFLPIHGGASQLLAHADLAREAGLAARAVAVATSGDVVAVDSSGIAVVDRVEAGRVPLDVAHRPLAPELLRDRRRLAAGGVLVPIVTLGADGALRGTPRLESRGVLPDGQGPAESTIAEAIGCITRTVREASADEALDRERLAERISRELKRLLKPTGRRPPVIVPVFLEG